MNKSLHSTTRRLLALVLLIGLLLLGAAPAAAETATVIAWSVEPGQGGIQLRWETDSEQDSIGFNIYRSRSNDLASAVKLTKQPISSQDPGSATGASYAYLDQAAKPGKTYYYWLEHITSGSADGGLFLMAVYDLSAGSWGKPQAVRVTPKVGGDASATVRRFTATFRDPDGDLANVYLLIGDAPDLTAGVALRYEVATGLLSLYDEGQGGWQPGIQARTAARLSGPWGTLVGKASRARVLAQGATLRIGWAVSFAPEFVGDHNLYIMAEDSAGNASGWQQAGTWQVR